MRKQFLLLLPLIFIAATACAQGFKWVKGGGGGGSPAIGEEKDAVSLMVADANGNVYAAARTAGLTVQLDTFSRNLQYGSNNNAQLLLFSYNCKGKLRWAKLIESSGIAKCNAMAIDATGRIYLSGNMPGNNKRIGSDTSINNQFNLSSYVLCYDTAGAYKWIRFTGTNVSNNDIATGLPYASLAIDGQGMVHYVKYLKGGVQISPTVTSTTGTYDIVYNNQGQLQSAVKLGIDSTWMMYSASLDNQTNKMYALGVHNTDYVNSYNILVAAFGPTRNRLWSDSTNFNANSSIFGDLIYYRKKLYLTGSGFNSFSFKSQSVSNPFGNGPLSIVMKADTNGNPLWIKDYSYIYDNVIYRMALMPNGRIAMPGLFAGKLVRGTDTLTTPTGQGQNAFFAIIDTSGNQVALKQIQGNGFYDRALAAAADASSNLYIGGSFESNVWADTLTPLSSQGGGNSDFFLMKYGYDCGAPCPLPVAAYSFTIDTVNKKLTLAYTGSTPVDSVRWRFGDGQKGSGNNIVHTYADTGTYRVCVYAYNSCGVDSFCQNIRIPLKTTGIAGLEAVFSGVKVYPNPSRQLLWIEGAEPGMKASLYAVTGALVLEKLLQSGKDQLDVWQLPSGTYLLQLKAADGRKAGTLILKQ